VLEWRVRELKHVAVFLVRSCQIHPWPAQRLRLIPLITDVSVGHSLIPDVPLGRVLFTDTVRYTTDDSSEEQDDWASLVPSTGPSAVLSSDNNTYTLAMFHQLACLRHVRDVYVADTGLDSASLVNHCLNYMRQAIMCHGETRIEPLIIFGAHE
jgi:hypothetical protein